MSKQVSISVIVPTYNRDLYIGRCIRSLLDQSLNRENYEIIVVNDGSKDNTATILKSYGNEITLVKNKSNKGLSFSLNKGIKKSKGRFIVRVDSDDYVNKEFLKYLQMYLLLNNEVKAVSCDYYLVDDKENTLEKKDSSSHPIGCGIMFRIESLIKIGLYDKNLKAHEDKDLRYRFLKKYKIHRLMLPLYRYRKHPNNMTKNKKNMKKYYKKLVTKHKKNI